MLPAPEGKVHPGEDRAIKAAKMPMRRSIHRRNGGGMVSES